MRDISNEMAMLLIIGIGAVIAVLNTLLGVWLSRL